MAHDQDDEFREFDEPDEDSMTTSDHRSFYQYGKLVLTVEADADHVAAIREYQEREGFYPDVYFISDHGNAHRIDLGSEVQS